MNTYSVSRKFQTQEDCVSYLEKLRWGKNVVCPYCGSDNTVELKNENRHHCNAINCKRSFSVMVGTIFEDSRLPLPKFFMIISLMMEAKNGISSSRLSSNLGISYKSAWYATMRVRCAMIETITDLSGIVEADESYLGGKPRKKNKPANDANLSRIETEQPKRGRGADKTKVAGFVERDGRVVVKVLEELTSQNLLAMLHRYVKEERTVMMTDDFRSYNSFDPFIERLVIKHSGKEYVKGNIHTNTIEGFWSIIKNGLRGQYHVLSKKYLPFYLAEWSYKYNRRNLPKLQFESFVKDALAEHKCMLCYKPEKDVKKIAYPKTDIAVHANVAKFNKANAVVGANKRKMKLKNKK